MSAPTAQNFAKPESITGGCLCGSVRYRVDFPKDHDFLKSSGSCQCTQCRRSTGSLAFFAHSIPLTSLTYLTPAATLKNFSATPGRQRGFCTDCGSFLYWRDESSPGHDLELAVGCVDPEFLVGGGEGTQTEGGVGFALANCRGPNVHCENEIRGVTEGLVGQKGNRWMRGSDGGVLMPDASE